MPLLVAPLLRDAGFRHGFSLRSGGVSRPPFASLNLARNVGDAPADVTENHARFARAVGYDAECLLEVSQIHGATVAEPSVEQTPFEHRQIEADALVCARPGSAIGVRIADCVPLLLADPGSGAVAAIHAGWRGIVAGVVEAGTSALLARTGARPAQLLAAVGPHIGLAHFEIGDEVAEQLSRAVAPAVVERQRFAKPHADLGLAVRSILERLGLMTHRIETVPGCTYADGERFFSYRRDGARSGRHLAAIVAGC